MAKNANLLTVFAEDVRHEKSGQTSVIGVFDDKVEIDEFPTTFTKLAIVATLSTLVDTPLEIDSFCVRFQNGETVMSQNIPSEVKDDLRASIEKARVKNEHEWFSMRFHVEMVNFKIQGESILEVVIQGSDRSIAKSNTLSFVKKSEQTVTHNISL